MRLPHVRTLVDLVQAAAALLAGGEGVLADEIATSAAGKSVAIAHMRANRPRGLRLAGWFD